MNRQLVGHVKSLYRYPIKSMQGESVDALEVGPFGAMGDRAFALRKPDGRVATAKRTTALLGYGAFIEGEETFVRTPAGDTLTATDPATSDKLSSLLNLQVTIERWQQGQENFGELDANTIFADVPIQEALEGKRRQLPDNANSYDLAPNTFFDSAHLHLLTTGTLKHLDGLLEGKSNIDVHRFRPNIFIKTVSELEGFIEDDWIDGQLKIGESVLIGEIWPTLRCVMTTLPQRDLPKDTSILRKIVREHENHLGIFATATANGTIKVGDSVWLEISKT